MLGLPEDGIVRDAPMRSNLRLKVLHVNGASGSGRALRSLTQLLREGELKDCRSVVVYCAYQVGSGRGLTGGSDRWEDGRHGRVV